MEFTLSLYDIFTFFKPTVSTFLPNQSENKKDLLDFLSILVSQIKTCKRDRSYTISKGGTGFYKYQGHYNSGTNLLDKKTRGVSKRLT